MASSRSPAPAPTASRRASTLNSSAATNARSRSDEGNRLTDVASKGRRCTLVESRRTSRSISTDAMRRSLALGAICSTSRGSTSPTAPTTHDVALSMSRADRVGWSPACMSPTSVLDATITRARPRPSASCCATATAVRASTSSVASSRCSRSDSPGTIASCPPSAPARVERWGPPAEGWTKIAPISNSATLSCRRSRFRPIDRSRPGSSDRRSRDSSTVRGFVMTTSSSARPIRATSPGATSELVQASEAPIPSITSRTAPRNAWRSPGAPGCGHDGRRRGNVE